MERKCFIVAACVLLLVAVTAPVRAQDATAPPIPLCMVDSNGNEWDVVLSPSGGGMFGIMGVVSGAFTGGVTWVVSGGYNRPGNMLSLAALDPSPGGSCPIITAFNYAGGVTGVTGGVYLLAGAWTHSCAGSGLWTGRGTRGPCPAPGVAPAATDLAAIAPFDAPASSAVLRPSAEGYALDASYPNPFSQQTSIRFTVPEATHVRLIVYDVLGREVAALVDEERGAGTHTVEFDASSLPGGTYVYRIQAGSYSEARQMMVIR
jgi:hypothetical protein